MFRVDKTNANGLYGFTVRDFVPDTSDVNLYLDLRDALDLDDFVMDYETSGQSAVHPSLMLRTIVYGLTHGIVSGRKLATACKFDNRFLVLSGEQMPDARTFQRFLVRHADRIPGLFVQVVQLAQEMGLVKLGTIAVDGSRFKANTSRNKAMSYGRMVTAVEALEHELAQMRKSLEEANSVEMDEVVLKGEIAHREKRLATIRAAKERIEMEKQGQVIDLKTQKSFNDLDALPCYTKQNGMSYVFNMTTAVDEESQIIVGCESHANTNDQDSIVPILDAVKEATGKYPENCLADAGFKKPENLSAMEDRDILPFVATGKGEETNSKTCLESVVYDEGGDRFRCPKGKIIPEAEQEGIRRILAPPKGFCIGCSKTATCPLFEKQGRGVTLPPEKARAAAARNLERMRSAQGKAKYKNRKAIVETPFGNMKNKSIKIFVTGKDKVRIHFKLFAIAHNVEKMIGKMAKAKAA